MGRHDDRSRGRPGRHGFAARHGGRPAAGQSQPRFARHRVRRGRHRRRGQYPRRHRSGHGAGRRRRRTQGTRQPARLDRQAYAKHGQEGDRVPLRRLQRLLFALARPGHGVFLRVFPAWRREPGRGPEGQAGTCVSQAAAAPGDDPARHRLRLGRAGDPCRPPPWRPGAGRHPVDESVRTGARARAGGRPGRPGGNPAAATIATSPAPRSTIESARSACSSTSA